MDFFKRTRINYFIIQLAKRIRLWKPVGNQLTIFPDDCFQIGYPKSGNTWLRYLIANALVPETMDFLGIQTIFPDVYTVNEATLAKYPRPRLIHAHFRCQVLSDYFQKPQYAPMKTIYIVRDPRDVAISMYYWLHKCGSFSVGGKHSNLSHYTLEDYLYYFPGEKERFGGWREHICGWMEMAEHFSERILIVKYEDLIKNPHAVLKKSLAFWGIEASEQTIKQAVEKSSPENMRKGEVKLPAIVLKILKKENIPFVREAKAGGWKNVFNNELNNIYWDNFGQWMEIFGYTK